MNKVIASFAVFVVGALAIGAASDRGGWVSSGGELLADARNPWFLKNTLEVRYCVQFAPEGLSISRAQALASVERSLDYWKQEFADLPPESNDIGVGEQSFVLNDSCEVADLTFQFGHETLSPEQLEHIRRPNDYVGLAVRTSYDPVNLKGRGFIFINSDIGPKRFVPSTAREKAWSTPYVLDAVLMHELGHVFGLPHVGSQFSLMSEGFPEMIVSQPVFDSHNGDNPDPAERFKFFTPVSMYFDCFLFGEAARKWFGLRDISSGELACVTIETRGDAKEPHSAEVFMSPIEVPAKDQLPMIREPQEKIKIADIVFEAATWEPVDVMKSLFMKVHVTDLQRVFEGTEIVGPPRLTLSNKGLYIPLKNPQDKRAIRMRIGSMEDFELLGVQDGDIQRLLKFML